jgi:hypothetical protein
MHEVLRRSRFHPPRGRDSLRAQIGA